MGTGMEKVGQLDQRSLDALCIPVQGIKRLPGFDTPTDVKCYSMIDGTRQGDPIRVGESWRTYINEQSIANQIRMTGFCMMDKKWKS